jgi:hypothetical protein
MGCKSSSEKDDQQTAADSRLFARLVASHPVAKKLRRLWDDFEDGSSTATGKCFQTEVAATEGPEEAVTHPSVAEVGQAFLGYLNERLQRLNWGGDYHFDVRGGPNYGVLEVTVKCQIGQGKHEFFHKIKYHAKPSPPPN